jgi:hypothetical protein
MPVAMPVNTPVDELTDANAGALTLHVPPETEQDRDIESPAQTFPGPVMVPASPTVSCIDTAQPDGSVYDMLVVPKEIPVTMPVPEPTVALAGSLLVQLPPAEVFARVTVVPGHTVVLPVIAEGAGRTVNTSEPMQPPDVVYDIRVVPGATAVTIPLEEMVATDVLVDDQVPPDMVAVIVSDLPAHMAIGPVNVIVQPETVISLVAKQPDESV